MSVANGECTTNPSYQPRKQKADCCLFRSALSKPERKDYIKAVQCLRELPSKSNPEFAPGARARYDDFVAVHINNTRTIRATGNFPDLPPSTGGIVRDRLDQRVRLQGCPACKLTLSSAFLLIMYKTDTACFT